MDRLEADHERVSDLLDSVEAAARALTDTDADEARGRVIDGLGDLRAHLLEHLDFERGKRRPGDTASRRASDAMTTGGV